jgi:hypothetical protein
MDKACRAKLLRRILDPSVQSAFEVIEREIGVGPLVAHYQCGMVSAVTFRSGRWYPFSFIPNAEDLLFYIRRPALNLNKSLHGLAEKNHPGAVNVNQRGQPAPNKTGETKIRIRSKREAEVLIAWLCPLIGSMQQQAPI